MVEQSQLMQPLGWLNFRVSKLKLRATLVKAIYNLIDEKYRDLSIEDISFIKPSNCFENDLGNQKLNNRNKNLWPIGTMHSL